MVLFDTDVMIDLLRGYEPALQWLNSLGDEEVLLPGYVAMELLQGCRTRAEQTRLQKQLDGYSIVWPTPEMCGEAMSVFVSLHLSHNIGIIDTLIGQLAISLDLPLNTFNRRHYRAIPNLKLVEPYPRR